MADWHHAPLHRFDREGTFFVTGSTYLKQHFYRSPSALDRLQRCLLELARNYECRLQSWALLSNHYHLVCVGSGTTLREMLSVLHSTEGIAVNAGLPEHRGQHIWYQFRDTQLTYERSWLARLHHTHANAVHHRLVQRASDYRWCSASWFETNASRSFVRAVQSFKIDRVNVPDEFVPLLPEEV